MEQEYGPGATLNVNISKEEEVEWQVGVMMMVRRKSETRGGRSNAKDNNEKAATQMEVFHLFGLVLKKIQLIVMMK